jgi:hypothetical protein
MLLSGTSGVHKDVGPTNETVYNFRLIVIPCEDGFDCEIVELGVQFSVDEKRKIGKPAKALAINAIKRNGLKQLPINGHEGHIVSISSSEL